MPIWAASNACHQEQWSSYFSLSPIILQDNESDPSWSCTQSWTGSSSWNQTTQPVLSSRSNWDGDWCLSTLTCPYSHHVMSNRTCALLFRTTRAHWIESTSLPNTHPIRLGEMNYMPIFSLLLYNPLIWSYCGVRDMEETSQCISCVNILCFIVEAK